MAGESAGGVEGDLVIRNSRLSCSWLCPDVDEMLAEEVERGIEEEGCCARRSVMREAEDEEVGGVVELYRRVVRKAVGIERLADAEVEAVDIIEAAPRARRADCEASMAQQLSW